MNKHPIPLRGPAAKICVIPLLAICLSAPAFAERPGTITTLGGTKPALEFSVTQAVPQTSPRSKQINKSDRSKLPQGSSIKGSATTNSATHAPLPSSTEALDELERQSGKATNPPTTLSQPDSPTSSAAPSNEVSIPESLSVYAAEALALQNNHTLNASQYRVLVAHEQLGAWMAKVYPSLDFSAGLTYGQDIESHPAKPIDDSTQTGLSLTLSAKQTLLDLSRRPSLRRSELAEVAELASFEGVRQDVLLEVRKAWFTAYIDQQILAIGRQTVANRKERLLQAQGLYRGGSKAKIDVAIAETDLANAQVAVIKLETTLQQDWVALNVAMGIRSSRPYTLVVDPYWDYASAIDEDTLVKIAFANRTELQVLKANLSSQMAYLDVLQAKRYPSLGLSASLSSSGNALPQSGKWRVGLGLDWNIFDGFLTKYNKSEARAQARVIAEQFYQQQMTIYKEVCNRIVAFKQSQAAIPVAQVALSKAMESYRLASARYKVGVAQSVEVSDAELALAQAQADLATAENSLRTAKAELIRVTGIEDLDNLPSVSDEITPETIPQ